ncbi:MAG: phage tail protein, partial [Pseudomonadota bacterium]|nr:phage tail protein [Pseudomonadota bacterium]
MANYYLILTDYGSQRLAAAQADQQPIGISYLAAGDANGLPYLPQSRIDSTALINELVRVPIHAVNVVGQQVEVVA